MKRKFSASCDISKNLQNKVRAANFKCGRIKDELISFSREGRGIRACSVGQVLKKKGGMLGPPPPSPSTARFLHYDREVVVANEGLVIIHYQEGGGERERGQGSFEDHMVLRGR